jgi:hypothetical protein
MKTKKIAKPEQAEVKFLKGVLLQCQLQFTSDDAAIASIAKIYAGDFEQRISALENGAKARQPLGNCTF